MVLAQCLATHLLAFMPSVRKESVVGGLLFRVPGVGLESGESSVWGFGVPGQKVAATLDLLRVQD